MSKYTFLHSTSKGMQSPIEGESFKRSFDDPDAPEKETQFYSMLDQRAIYSQGWLANTLYPPLSGWDNFTLDTWELYKLKEDRSQMNNVAIPHPERVETQRSVELLRRRPHLYHSTIARHLKLCLRSVLRYLSHEVATSTIHMPQRCSN